MSRIGSEWNLPSRFPNLPEGAVHVWLADLEACRHVLARCCALLRPDEQERAARYREGEPRTRYQLTRGLLRRLLSQYVASPPTAVTFVYNTQGKPELADGGLHFNVSHTGGFSAFAFTRVGPAGVDIERVRPEMPRLFEIAQRYFAPAEFRGLEELALDDRAAAFFRCWTRKEAVLKAKGDGIFGGLDAFEVGIGPQPELPREPSKGDLWIIADLPAVPGCAGAVAVHGTEATKVSFEHWSIDPQSFLDGA